MGSTCSILNQIAKIMMDFRFLFLLAFAATYIGATELSRKPKLFFATISSSTSTSTSTTELKTVTFCYVTAKAGLSDCKRRKRSAVIDSQPESFIDLPQPSRSISDLDGTEVQEEKKMRTAGSSCCPRPRPPSLPPQP